jgi:hypothetical protein
MVSSVDSSTVKVVVKPNAVYDPDTIRAAAVDAEGVRCKRKPEKELANRKKVALAHCAALRCDIKHDGLQKKRWSECKSFGVLAEDPENPSNDVECCFRVCDSARCLGALKRHEQRCISHHYASESSEDGTRRRSNRR